MMVVLIAAIAAGGAVLLLGARARPSDARRVDEPGDRAMPARVGRPRRARAERTRSGRSPPLGSRRHARLVAAVLPDALDLFTVTVEAGYAPVEALRLIEPIVDGPVGPAIDEVLARIERSERWTAAVTALVDHLGPSALGFVDALVQSEQSGLGIAPLLERLADDARRHRRRLAEIRARELPIQLSFPLVCCTLPAFVLVAIVPVLIGAWSSLRLR